MPVSYRLGAYYFLFFVSAGLVVAYLPPYLAARGLSAAEIAWVLAAPQLARVLAPGAWGLLADRTGARRTIVVLASAANAVCFALLPVMPGFAAIVALTAVSSLVATAVLPGGVWLESRSVLRLPYAVALFSLGTVALGALLPSQEALPGPSEMPAALDRAALAILASGFFMAAAHGTLYAFLTLHLQRLGYSASLIGFLWLLGVAAEVGVFVFLPALFRRYRLSTLLMASAALGVARFLAIGWLADSLAMLLLAQLLHAATFGSYHAAAIAAVHRVFAPRAQARG